VALFLKVKPNGTHGIAVAYTPGTDQTYAYMKMLAQLNNLTIASSAYDNDTSYDIVPFDDFGTVCDYYTVNPFAGTIGE
jgi:hypothetical protein